MISYRTALCFVVALGLTSVAAMGQAVPPLPAAFRNQVAFNPDEVKTIQQFLAAQIVRLTGEDVTQQQRAREDLVAGGTGSVAYGQVYAQELNNALTPVVKGKEPRARLNAAIAAARVAEKDNVDASRLAGLSLLMIADKDDAIVLWGIKTARSAIPAMFNAQGAAASPALIKVVLQAALSRGSGPIVAEAYQALAPNTAKITNLDPLVKATFPALMQLMATRNRAYLTGVPDEPTAETGALFFVSLAPVWKVLAPGDKAQVVQQVSDLVGMAGQRWSSANREHLTPLIQQAGKALVVIGDYPDVKNPGLSAAGAALARINPSVAPADVAKAVAAAHPAIKAVPSFQGVTPPPTVNPMPQPVTTAPAGPATSAEPATAKSTNP